MRKLILLLAIPFLIATCRDSSFKKYQSKVMEMAGQEIVWPDSLDCYIQDVLIESDLADADFKVVTFIDSAGCTPCKMQLAKWNQTINEFKSLPDVDVSFLMILESDHTKEIDFAVENYNFLNPIALDAKGLFRHHNSNLLQEGDNSFLLDYDNRIVAIGNPAINPKIREIYRSYMTGESPTVKDTSICPEPTVALGAIHQGDTVIKRFTLINDSPEPLTIQEMVPSCDCVTAILDSDTIMPEGTSYVTIRLVGDSVPGGFRRYVDVFFNEKSNPERLTLHGFVINNNSNF